MSLEIKYIDRESKQLITENVPSSGALKFLYYHPFGKVALNGLVKRKFLSSFVGRLMNTRISKRWIESFINNHNIPISEYKKEIHEFKSFNDFFYRELKPNSREISENVISPGDGKVVAFNSVGENNTFYVKGCEFSLNDFLKEEHLADKYKDGTLVIVRLAPSDYHRFHFPLSGKISKSKKIKGKYYSVSPIALKKSLEISVRIKENIVSLKIKTMEMF